MGWLDRQIAENNNLPLVAFAEHEKTDQGRYHVTPYGNLPGVTTILNATKPEFVRNIISSWRDNNPNESERCLERGNILHKDIENHFGCFIEDRASPLWSQLEGFVARLKPLMIEYPLFSLSGFAGSPDCLAEHDGLILCDWKSSTKNKSDSQVIDYKIQLAAYDKLIQENLGLSVDRACIALARESHDTARFFWVEREELDQLYQIFLERLEEFNSMFSVGF